MIITKMSLITYMYFITMSNSPISYKVNLLSYSVLAILLSQSITANEEVETAIQQLPTIVLTTEKTDTGYTKSTAKTALPLNISVKETPQSVSVVTRQRIEDQQLKNVTEVAENTTGIIVQKSESNRGNIYSRGFQVDNYQIDGVSTPYSTQWSQGEIFSSTDLVDRVEVVRGATGLLTGPGNPSAAINMIRKTANSSEPAANLEVSGGSWNQYHVMGDVANALTEDGSLRGRAVLSYEEGDSFRNKFNKDIFTGLLTAEYDISDRTLLTAGISYQQDDTHSPTWGGLPAVFSNGALIPWSRSTTIAPDWARWETDYTNIFASLRHRFENDWELKASYEYGDRDGHSKLMYLSGAPDPVNGSGVSAGFGQYFTNTTQDTASLQLSGDFNLLDKKHDFALGYQYSNQDFSSDYTPVECSDKATNPWCDVKVSNLFNWDFTDGAQPNWGDRTLYERQNIKQNSFYGVTRWSIAEPLKLILGARLTDYEKSGYGLYTQNYTQHFDHQFIPYAGLVYELTPQLSTYASYTSIFQPQAKKDKNGQYLDPVEGNNYELGIKGSFLDERLNASAAVFKIEQDNYGVKTGEKVNFGQGDEDVYKAIDGSSSEGFEVEVSGRILPQWNITAGYAQFNLEDTDGKKIDRDRPNKTANLFTSYDFSQQFAPITVGAGLRWQNATHFNVTGGEIKQDSYALIDLMGRYQISPEVALQMNVRNLTDKKSYNISSNQLNFNDPRNVNMMLSYKF